MKPDTADADFDGALYPARVSHRRFVKPLYRFVYRIFYVLVDIDRLDALSKRLRLFSVDRFNLLALYRRDYGDRSGDLRGWAERVFAEDGLELAGGRIYLLTLPRVLGYGFNPISLWYGHHADGRLLGVIAEVHNTFGERHHYRLPLPPASTAQTPAYQWRVTKDKGFHVSPFFDLVGRYHFTLSAPAERLRVVIHETREGAPLMGATLAAERRALKDVSVLSHVLRMPWMTVKVIAGIHWEALKLWLRGAPFHRKPEPPATETS